MRQGPTPRIGSGNRRRPVRDSCAGRRPNSSRSACPPRPMMSILASEPVIASNPVASTIDIDVECASEVLMPVASIDSIGVLAHAHNVDIRPVERLKVVGVGADSLRARSDDRRGSAVRRSAGHRLPRGPSPPRTCALPRWPRSRSSGRERSSSTAHRPAANAFRTPHAVLSAVTSIVNFWSCAM